MAFPYPGTELYKIDREKGLFNEEDLYSGGNQDKSGLRTIYLSNKELNKLKDKADMSILLNLEYLLRTISHIRSPKVFINYAKFGISLIIDKIQNK